MDVRLGDPQLVSELIGFLSRCECRAVQVAHDVVRIEVRPATRSKASLRLVRQGRCISCGEQIAPALAEVGSLKCHDCRDRNMAPHEHPGHPAVADVQLDGYLHVWSALHPGAAVTLLPGSSGRAGISAT